MATPSPAVGLRAFVDAYDVVLCDVFGTLHDETGIFPDAIEALVRYRDSGRVVILVSNSAYPGAALADHLTSRGVPASAFDAIVTSADVTRTLLDDCQGTVHHIGLPAERVLFEDMPVAFAQVEAADLVVCTGCPEEDFAPVLARAGERGLELICTNPDTSVAVAGRVLRFAGLVADAYRAIGGRVTDTGKPARAIYAAALDRAAELLGRVPAPERVLGVGDSISLDVEGALARGFGALWINGDRMRPSGSSTAPSAASLAW